MGVKKVVGQTPTSAGAGGKAPVKVEEEKVKRLVDALNEISEVNTKYSDILDLNDWEIVEKVIDNFLYYNDEIKRMMPSKLMTIINTLEYDEADEILAIYKEWVSYIDGAMGVVDVLCALDENENIKHVYVIDGNYNRLSKKTLYTYRKMSVEEFKKSLMCTIHPETC